MAGEAASWIIVPLILAVVVDVITRRIGFIKLWAADITIEYGFSPSYLLQDLEWHLHGALLLLTLGFAYLSNAHVRIDIFRERASARRQVWIELIGLLTLAIPFLLVMIYFSWVMTAASLAHWEGSESQVGLGWRFVIKSFLVLGFTLMLFAVLSTVLRCLIYLFGNARQRQTIEGTLQFQTAPDSIPSILKDTP